MVASHIYSGFSIGSRPSRSCIHLQVRRRKSYIPYPDSYGHTGHELYVPLFDFSLFIYHGSELTRPRIYYTLVYYTGTVLSYGCKRVRPEVSCALCHLPLA